MSTYTVDENGQIIVTPEELDEFEYYRDNLLVRLYREMLTLNPIEYIGWILNIEGHSTMPSNPPFGYYSNLSTVLTYNSHLWNIDNITIPNGATIDTAVVNVSANGNSDHPFGIYLAFEDTDDASPSTSVATFKAILDNLTSTVTWSKADEEDPWISVTRYTSPSLVTPLQTVINRAGWASGQAVNFIVTPSTPVSSIPKEASLDYYRSAYGYGPTTNYRLDLEVTWSNPTGSNTFEVVYDTANFKSLTKSYI
jgi:hypothetical protein